MVTKAKKKIAEEKKEEVVLPVVGEEGQDVIVSRKSGDINITTPIIIEDPNA